MQTLAIIGATATGKSALALALARRHTGVELVSVDSMQVYRGMDIGTAKPTTTERAEIPHHLIDLVEPSEGFTVARFQDEARQALAVIAERGHRAVLVGGTGLYLQAVVDDLDIPGQWPELRAELDAEATTTGAPALHARLAELDPVAAGRMAPVNTRRVVRALEVTLGSGRPFSSFGPGLERYGPTSFRMIGIALSPGVVAERIARRYEAQMAAGFLDEVRALAARPDGLSRTARQALGYRELLSHLDGELALDEAVDFAVRRTRQFARRQRAWFRRDPRIHWLQADHDPAEVLDDLSALFEADEPAD